MAFASMATGISLANALLNLQVILAFDSVNLIDFIEIKLISGKTCSDRATSRGVADPIDQCQGQPCHNGGTCESGPGWFRCVCAQGFSGPDCRINVNECSPQPCLGGATCIDGIGGFTCICPKGRRGARCEIRKSKKHDNEVLNS